MSTMMDTPLALITVFVTLCISTCVTEFAACDKHNPTEDGELKFKDDLNRIVEIGYEENHKDFVCFAQNYCHITWKKDGWPINDTHSVRVDEEGQRLQFLRLQESDQGEYSCEASNGSSTTTGHITLYVVKKDCNDKTSAINLQHHGCQNATAQIGEDVGFDCLFYVGYSHDPDQLLADWYKVNESAADSAYDDDHWIFLEPSSTYNISEYRSGALDNRSNCPSCGIDCLPEYGARLTIRNISAEAYGHYVLYVDSEGRSTKVILEISEVSVAEPSIGQEVWNHWLIFPMVSLVAFFVLVSVVWQRFKVDIKLSWKNLTPRDSKDRSKENDVYLSYDWNNEIDSAFAIKLHRFLTELGYRVFFEAHCLPGGVTDEDIYQALRTSCRCVIIFSPDYLVSYRQFDVILAMDNIQSYKKDIIPIIYRDISAMPEEMKSALVRQILSVPSLRYDKIPSRPLNGLQKLSQRVLGVPCSMSALHKELQLRLPPPDRPSQQSAPSVTDSVTNFIQHDEINMDLV